MHFKGEFGLRFGKKYLNTYQRIYIFFYFYSVENEEPESIPSTSDRRNKFDFEQLLNSSKQLEYLQNIKNSSASLGINTNLSHTSRLEGYRNLVNSSEPMFQLENNSEQYKNLHMKVLVLHFILLYNHY